MIEELKKLEDDVRNELQALTGAEPIEALRVKYLGRKGILASLSAQLPSLSAEQKPLASLVEVGDTGCEKRFAVTTTEHWIGRDSRLCSMVLDDPMVSPRHARLYRDKQNRWLLANAKSLNGIWLRINRIDLGPTAQFQLGEQRFSIRTP